MKTERTRFQFSATFSLPSPSSDLKVPIIAILCSASDVKFYFRAKIKE